MRKSFVPDKRNYLAIGAAISFLAILSFLSLPAKIQACSPEEPDYWYLETIKVSNADIPEQLEISQVSKRNFEISNQSLRRYDVWLLTHEVQNYLVREGKYIDGAAIADHFNKKSYSLSLQRSLSLDLLDYSGFHSTQKDWPFNSINDFVYPDYQDLNVAADGLSGEPKSLIPQQLSLAFNVEGTLQIVSFTIHYSSNPDYDPQRERRGINACYEFNLTDDAIMKLQSTTPETDYIPSTPDIQPSFTPAILTSTPVSEQQAFVPTKPNAFPSLSSIRGALWLIPFILAAIFLRFRLKST